MVTALTAFTGLGLYFAALWYLLELGVGHYGRGTRLYDVLWSNRPTKEPIGNINLINNDQTKLPQETPESPSRLKMLMDEVREYLTKKKTPSDPPSNGVISKTLWTGASPIPQPVRRIPRMEKLLNIDIIFSSDLHSGLTRHAQFSPNGDFLATAG